MESQPMVSYWTGSMNLLVNKLAKLKNHPKIIEELHEDLVSLQKGLFDKLDGRREMSMQVGAWMNQVRELVFDIEDWIDQKQGRTDLREIEEEVYTFKSQIEQARELCTRYNLVTELPTHPDVADGASSKTTGYLPLPSEEGSRLLDPQERNGLLALEDSKRYLEESLRNMEMKLKVVSIVGMEGCGKTSLAKEIYGNLQGQFDCHAFVLVGRRPSVRATLLNILRQVKPGSIPRDGKTSQDLHKVITELWEYLGTKRYFILVDGLWSKRAWKVINCALPDKNCGSRVLTTTCIISVAENCCMHSSDDLYAMKALSEDNSRILYLRSLRAVDRSMDGIHEDGAYVHEVSTKLLKLCDGMPIAIIVAAGLLSGKCGGLSNGKIVEESTISSLEQYSTSKGMAMILDMSYADLSLPMKSCFLYLSVFPEDYTINKNRLIQLWVVEGFIPGEEAELLWFNGERYFNELIIRGLIQPVFEYDDDKPVGCTVHGVIIDFLRSLSSKEEFVTVAGDLSSGIFPCSTQSVRRFSLDCCNNRGEADILASSTVHLSSMRSFTVFGDAEEKGGRSALTVSWSTEGKPVLPGFKLMRVLDLEDADNLRSHHLKGIEGMVLLKYLGLRGTGIDELPQEIGELEHLETLDVRQTKLATLPTSIDGLKRLSRLLLDSTVKLPSNLYEMEGLEELSTIGLHDRRSFFGVAQLLSRSGRRLRVLGVCFAALDHESVNWLKEVRLFRDSVALSRLAYLYVHNLRGGFVSCMWFSFQKEFRKLELTVSSPMMGVQVHGITSGVTHLHIEVIQVGHASIGVLAKMPHLVLLKLVSSGKDTVSTLIKRRRRRCIISGVPGAFRCLKVFWFICKTGGQELQFGSGAMPQLRRLRLSFSAWDTLFRYGEFEFGIQHLTRLTRLHTTISCRDATVSEVEKAEAAIREQAHKASATVEFSRDFENKMHNGEMNTIDRLKTKVKRITSLLL